MQDESSLHQKSEHLFEKILDRPKLSIAIICGISLLLRTVFSSFDVPSNSLDAFIYAIGAINISRGSLYEQPALIGWQSFLAIFFTPFRFDTYTSYMVIAKLVSIFLSVGTIPVVYLIGKEFVDKKFALIASAFFGFEANLIENSIFGITEPLFILLSLFSFYFAIHKNEKFLIYSFAFAGLASDTRLNGVVLLVIAIIAVILRIKPAKRLSKYLGIGFAMFVIFNLPYLIINFGDQQIPYLSFGSSLVLQADDNIQTPSFYASEYGPTENKYAKAVITEVVHVFRLGIPYLAPFVLFGIFVSKNKFDKKMILLYLVLAISFLIAIPQYTVSVEYRNLFLMIPFFCVLSSIGIEHVCTNTKLKNVFLVLLLAGLLLLSYNFLRERYDVDLELVKEKETFGKYVATQINGTVMGDNFNYILHNIPDVRGNQITHFKNEHMKIWRPPETVTTIDDLIKYSSLGSVTHLVIDNEKDIHFPIFYEIFFNESKYPFLIKIFDSDEQGYKKYRVKIFEIDYGIYEKINS